MAYCTVTLKNAANATVSSFSEADIVAGGCKIVLTLGGDQWIASGTNYLLQEDFEGPGYQSGTWTETLAGGTITENYNTSPAPLDGSYSLYIVDGSSYTSTQSPSFAEQSTIYAYFMYRPLAINTTVTEHRIFNLGSGMTLRARQSKLMFYHGTVPSALASTVMDINTTYHVWLQYTKDPGGSTGTGSLYISTTATKPGSPSVSLSNGNGSVGITFVQLQVQHSSGSESYGIFDKIRVSPTDIGSDPA